MDKLKLDKLDEHQLKSVNCKEKCICVSSVPGSGKTRIIVNRVRRLINDGTKPSKILVITFTNKAVNEVKTRLSIDNIHIRTLHSLSYSLINQLSKKKWSVWLSKDITYILKDLLEEGKIENPISLNDLAKILHNGTCPDIIKTFCQIMLDNFGVGFDFMSYLASYFILEAKKTKWHCPFEHVLIDEFQDIDKFQFTMIQALNPLNLFVVGDANQCIYQWRNATSNYIRNFEKFFPGSSIFTTRYNYRSISKITIPASLLISKQCDHIIPVDKSDGIIESHIFNSQIGEAGFIADYIKRKASDETIAVLYRRHSTSFILQKIFMSKAIPFKVRINAPGEFGVSNRELCDILSVFRASINPEDIISKERSLQLVKGIGKSKSRRILDGTLSADKKSQNILDAMDPEISFQTKLDLIQEAGIEIQPQLLETLLQYADNTDLLESLVNSSMDTEGKSNWNFLTFHSAKGLEFDTVFIIGCVDSILHSTEEEDKNLLYVAITRARRNLYICSPKFMAASWGDRGEMMVDKHIREIDRLIPGFIKKVIHQDIKRDFIFRGKNNDIKNPFKAQEEDY